MHCKNALYYLAVGFLIFGVFLGETEARRKVLQGRKVLTRRYYRPRILPAWSISLLAGFGMVVLGGILFVILKKTVIDSIDDREVPSYQPAMSDEV